VRSTTQRHLLVLSQRIAVGKGFRPVRLADMTQLQSVLIDLGANDVTVLRRSFEVTLRALNRSPKAIKSYRPVSGPSRGP
jgi:hypothetical protein